MTQTQALESIDRNIRHYMADEDITAGEMASRLGMSDTTLRWKRKGEQDWKWKEVLKLSELTGLTVGKLIGEEV